MPQDKLVTVSSDPNPATTSSAANTHWIFKNKDHGKTTATASIGMVTLWDVEGGLPQIDKYLYSTDNQVRVQGLGVGFYYWGSILNPKLYLTIRWLREPCWPLGSSTRVSR